MTTKLLLVAGGTGGHILPAISFGQWIGKNKPEVSVSYICGRRPLEMEIYSYAGIEPYKLQIEGSPFSGRGLDKVKRTYGQLSALKESVRIYREEIEEYFI